MLVTDIAPLDSSPFEQRLRVSLRIRNPNDYELQVTGVDVRLEFNGKRLARGLSNKEFTVPRLGEPVVIRATCLASPPRRKRLKSARRRSRRLHHAVHAGDARPSVS